MSSEDEESESEGREAGIVNIINIITKCIFVFGSYLPVNTPQFVILFCVIPITISFSAFAITFLINFGIAFIAQTISSIIILLLLIPCLSICIITAVAVAYSFDVARVFYSKLTTSNHSYIMDNQTKIKLC